MGNCNLPEHCASPKCASACSASESDSACTWQIPRKQQSCLEPLHTVVLSFAAAKLTHGCYLTCMAAASLEASF